jgi:hypothetical protein
MKKSILTLFSFSIALAASSQVQLDKAIQLTGSGSDAKVSGIDNVSASKDAVSAEVVQSNALSYAAAAGAVNTFTVTLAPALTAYSVGQAVTFKANLANTASASVNVNGLGAKTIKKNGDADLAANDIKINQFVTVVYDGTNFQMVSQLGNASGGSSAGDPTLIYTTDGF